MYLTASVAERARRRASELGVPAAGVELAIAERDRRDAAQLAPAAGRAHGRHDRARRRAGDRARARAGARGRSDERRSSPDIDRAWRVLRRFARGRSCWLLLRPRVVGRRERAGRRARPHRVEPRVVVGHPGARLVAAALDPLHGEARALGLRHDRLAPALGRGVPGAARRARPRCAPDRARDGRGRRRGRASSSRATARRSSRAPRPAPAAAPSSRTCRSCPRRSGAPGGGGRDRRISIVFGEPRTYERGDRRPGEAYRETADELMAEIRRLYETAG